MFQALFRVDFAKLEEALPAFVTFVLIPLTLSITQGILWGFLLHAVMHAVVGRARDVSATLWALAALSAHEAKFPQGQLVEERSALEVLALATAGRGDEARVKATAFRQRFPSGLFRRLVDAAVAEPR